MSWSVRTTAIDHVGIVVPAHNEAATLPRCLRSLAATIADVDAAVSLVVILDSCSDRSQQIVSVMSEILNIDPITIVTRARAVGTARRLGADAILDQARLADVDPHRLWIATTDADTVVPASWLRAQLAHARAGATLVAGTVEVTDWSEWPSDVPELYRADYELPLHFDGHGHIHGANLGVRADVYTRAGGFPAVASDEDIAFVRAAQQQGTRVTWADDLAVLTSARPEARAPKGFAGHLHDLGASLASGASAVGHALGNAGGAAVLAATDT